MPDIFGRRPLDYGGSFSADGAQIEIAGLVGIGLIVQQLSIQYQQPITRIYEVGTQKTYFVAGRPQGTANIASVLGPGSVFSTFYQLLGDVCNAPINDLRICLQAGCTTPIGTSVSFPVPAIISSAVSSGMQLIAKNMVLQSIGLAVAAQDMVINQQLGLFFTSLLMCANDCPTAATITDVCP